MSHAWIGTEPTGALNAHDGELDACLLFSVGVGIPLWFSVRGHAHVIEERRLDDDARLAGLAGLPGAMRGEGESGDLHLPLRRRTALTLMAAAYWVLWILGIFAIVGLALLLTEPPPDKPVPTAVNVMGFGALAAFPVVLAAYRIGRRPSGRGARIRAAMAEATGTFSDPAEWEPATARGLAAVAGISGDDAAALLGAAERLRRSGDVHRALLAARTAATLLVDEGRDAAGAERLTDLCLESLASPPWPAQRPRSAPARLSS